MTAVAVPRVARKRPSASLVVGLAMLGLLTAAVWSAHDLVPFVHPKRRHCLRRPGPSAA
jgi:hypothetical protein